MAAQEGFGAAGKGLVEEAEVLGEAGGRPQAEESREESSRRR